jgi:hypothetical protein
MISSKMVEMLISQAPAVAVLFYVAWQQQKLINLVIKACMKHLKDEASNEAADPQ